MNIDFDADPVFAWYVIMLFVSGLLMVAIALLPFGRLSNGLRAFNGVAGVCFAGYAYYLNFVFEGGHYAIFFYAFILPVMMIARFVRSLTERAHA
ncbi:hypothetical protein ACWEQL_32580 [Kitasatospora sp. NPDC004240]